jgi:hypothetical protein
MIDDYPLEFRAFIRDGLVVGISNYFPQRPLTGNEPGLWFVLNEVSEAAEMLVDRAELIWHNCAQLSRLTDLGLTWRAPQFTADFIVDGALTVYFLEAGPPYTPTWGAHPCCFQGREISGVALAPSKPVDRYGRVIAPEESS